MFTRLLLPLDGSKLAESALPVAVRLARAFDATLVLLHLIERGAPATVHGDPHLTSAADAEAYLRKLSDALSAGGTRVEQHVHTVPIGDVPRCIAEHAEEVHADLTVLSAHGRPGLRALVSGRIAEQVLRHGKTPLLLVRPPAGGHPAPAFSPQDILAPLDGSAEAEAALAPAAALALALGSRLHLVAVVATPGTVRGDRLPATTLLPAATRALLQVEETQTVEYLDGLAARLRASSLDVVAEVRRGDTAGQLLADATEHQFGLVVVATHGHAGLQALLSGSVAARLIGGTTAPVLLLRRVDRG